MTELPIIILIVFVMSIIVGFGLRLFRTELNEKHRTWGEDEATHLEDYYDFLSSADKAQLAEEYLSGPKPGSEGVHPRATMVERERIAAKRFSDKFLRNDLCPMGTYPPRHQSRPNIRDRLIADGALSPIPLPKGVQS